MLDFGILCHQNGALAGITEPYTFLLQKHGISFKDLSPPSIGTGIIEVPKKKAPKGKSKLKLWECGCGQKARVGRTRFHAFCTKCGQAFVKKE